MTNEKTIEWLESIKKKYIHGGDEGFDTKRIEAINNAIKVLESKPCEDAVSRADVISLANKGYLVSNSNYKSICDVINALPSVTPTRHHGEWEETVVLPRAYDIMGNKTWASQMRCNKCEFATFAVEGKFSQYNFCPNCGADMREVKTDADSD